MQLGMIGLGRMGANMVRRLLRARHECVVFDPVPEAVASLVREQAIGAASIKELMGKLRSPRFVWLMVPAAVVDQTIEQVREFLTAGDTVIDGGKENTAELRAADAGKQKRAVDAETTPLRDPEHYQYQIPLPQVAEVWRRGSVIASRGNCCRRYAWGLAAITRKRLSREATYHEQPTL